MKRIAILGSTGSVGTSTLSVLAAWPDRFRLVGLAAGKNVELMLEQVRRFKPEVVSVASAEGAEAIRREFPGPGLRVVEGARGLSAVAAESGADMVVAALVGAVGLEPTLAAITAGVSVALANKETLVMAGEAMTAAAQKSGAALLPVDSEHAALHQILDHRPAEQVKRLVLTASGGPFRTTSLAGLAQVTLAQALKHPTWEMGAKITGIDSATLANKALEVIEARWLFGVGAERIGVLVHPQSIVHALVEFTDGTYLAQLGVTDMRSPIQYALSYPERWPVALPDLDLARAARLDFEEPDLVRFPALRLGIDAAHAGGTAPAIFNAANEVANAAFRAGRLDFIGIPAVIEAVLGGIPTTSASELAAVLEADRRARAEAERRIEERQV